MAFITTVPSSTSRTFGLSHWGYFRNAKNNSSNKNTGGKEDSVILCPINKWLHQAFCGASIKMKNTENCRLEKSQHRTNSNPYRKNDRHDWDAYGTTRTAWNKHQRRRNARQLAQASWYSSIIRPPHPLISLFHGAISRQKTKQNKTCKDKSVFFFVVFP